MKFKAGDPIRIPSMHRHGTVIGYDSDGKVVARTFLTKGSNIPATGSFDPELVFPAKEERVADVRSSKDGLDPATDR